MRFFTTISGKGIWLSFLMLLAIGQQETIRAEGTPSLAPDPADAAALYIGAGNTGGLGGDYGQFAWIGSTSRLYFNLQQLNEKAYIGFSLPWNNREFVSPNPRTNQSGNATNLEFRIVAPDGTHLTCFGNASGWQSLSTGNIFTRSEVVAGPAPIAGASGYQPFIFDPSSCSGLSQTGDYYIEFRSTDPSYNPNQASAGFYIEYFDITVANASNTAINGRVWSNNWGLGIKSDGDGPFDRAFNGAFYVCSSEGFVSKINFKNGLNTRTEAGKNNDQRSGFRAGSFNVSFNTTGPNTTGNIITDRKSRMNINSPNPELRVFLNTPSDDLCEPVEVGAFAPAPTLLTGCANDRCINMTATQPGQVEILIEKEGGNGMFDAPSDRLLGYAVTADDLVNNPQVAGFVYEFCIPWDGKDGEGNFLADGSFTIAGFYSQGIYHFPVYDAEFNDDGFTVETIIPALGLQKTYYDDTNILESNNIPGESKNGAMGCEGACHRWTGEWEDYVFGTTNNSDNVYGNFNTINTWWFAVTQTSDVSGNINNNTGLSITCPPNSMLCAGSSIEPAIIGSGTGPDNCPVQIEFNDVTKSEQGCKKVIERTWKAMITGVPDAAECVQTITLEDTAGPIITPLPKSILVTCDAVPTPPTTYTITDNCDQTLTNEDVIFTETRIDGSCPNNYVLKREWRISDACGNSNTYQQTVTVQDTQGPIISGVSADITVACANLPAVPTTIMARDICGGTVPVDFKEEAIAGTCNIRRTWTATDACGNTRTETQTIKVNDTTKPQWVNFRTTVVTDCSDALPDTTPTATDDCGTDVTVTLVKEEREEVADCPDGYNLIKTWRAEDACGNKRTKKQTVKVRDNTKPEWVDFPKVECIECSATPSEKAPIAIDNCDNAVEVTLLRDSIAPGDCANDSELFRFWQAMDNCGNKRVKRQRITIKDTTKPEWSNFPNNIVADCDDIPANTKPTATDNCAAVTITMLSEEIEGACGEEKYRMIRTWEAKDECGNTRKKKQFIRLRDKTKPSWTNFPRAITVSCDAIPAVSAPSATDNCTDNVSVNLIATTKEDQTCDNTYTLVREWRAIDACGNTRTRKQFIYVKDEINPTWVNFPAAQTLACGTEPAMVAPTAIDNCGETAVVELLQQTEESGTCNGRYTMFREWSATDACGNSITKRQQFNFVDEEKPEWTYFPLDKTTSCGSITNGGGANGPSAAAIHSDRPMASDNCGANVHVQLVETTRVDGNCIGNYTLRHKWSATDNCGNIIERTQEVKVMDTTKPVLWDIPANITASCDAIPTAPTITATDDCDPTVTVQLSESRSGNDCSNQTLTRTWTAMDACGNMATASQVITLQDEVKPTWGAFKWNSTLQCGTTPTLVAPTATDNCGEVTVTLLREFTEPGDCATPTMVRRWRVSDACGNRRTRNQYIKFRDNQKPDWVNFPKATRVSCDAIPAPSAPEATDACSAVSVEHIGDEKENIQCTGKYTLFRTWKVSDACGNSRTRKQRFNVVDTTKPDWVTFPDNITVECEALSEATKPTFTDGCSEVTLTFLGETKENEVCAGKYTLFRHWQIEDACGNKRTKRQRVNVRNKTKPTWVNFPKAITVNCDAIPAPKGPSATGACGTAVQVNLVEETTEEGICPIVQKIYRKWEAVDGCGNRITKTELIRVRDRTVPVLTTEASDLQLDCSATNAEASLQAWIENHGGASVTDNCDEVTWFHDCPKMEFNCGNTYEVTFTAVDGCGNKVITKAMVNFGDSTAPTLTGIPANIKIACETALPAIPTVTATDNCDTDVSIVFEEERENSTCANAYTLIRTWTATDDCGNSIEEEQVISVVDDTPPVLTNVPTNTTLQCGGIQGPSAASDALVVTATDNCDGAVQVVETSAVTGSTCAGAIITKTWTATDACGNTSSLSQKITLEDTTPPSIVCPPTVNVQAQGGCGASGRINIDLPVAQDNCDQNVLVTSSANLDGDFPAGTTTVQLTATDDCGNIANCSFNVVVSGGTPALSTQPCPENITISCDALAGQALATWEPPSGDACCSQCTGAANISGYTFLGERGGHRYYLSTTNVNWNQAKTTANEMGGYLAVINDPAENAFLAGLIQQQKVYIGLTDMGSEGNFKWTNGETLTYRNWGQQQPNNKNNNQHVVQLLPDGTWNDTYTTDKLPFLIEMTCIDVQQTAGPMNGSSFPVGTSTISYRMKDNCGKTQTCSFTVTVEPSIQLHIEEDVTFECKEGRNGYNLAWDEPAASSCCDDCLPVGEHPNGYVYMGRRNGHQYYCSLGKASYAQATSLAGSLNGYLVVINTQEENDFLTNLLEGQSAYIGLSDKAEEGKYRWQNGDPFSFKNWASGQPNNNTGAHDYVRILSNGKWDDVQGNQKLEFIIEVPCMTVEQTSGLSSGSFFGPGLHTITYRATDNCGNTAQESFNITINACSVEPPTNCAAKGGNDTYFWIKNIRSGSINNTSGKDGGYGDYTDQRTTFLKGSRQQITMSPGFSGRAYAMFWRVYIDYNQDGDFTDIGEKIVEYNHTNPIQANFSISNSAKLGTTTMRVVMAYGKFHGGCQSFSYGEVEDYTVVIANNRGAITENTEAGQSRSKVQVEVLQPEVQLLLGTTLEADLATVPTSINVYPNPVNSLLTIDLDQIATTSAQLRIFNSVGQQVYLKPLSEESQQQILLDVSDYQDGIYLISIEQEKQQPLLKKFTKF